MFKTRVKKGFTLVELIIVIILISATYVLVFSTNNFSLSKSDASKISLVNLKEYLIKNFEFEKSLKFVCIEDSFDCYIKKDDELLDESKVKGFFKAKPQVFKYQKEQELLEFNSIEIDNTDYDVVFEYSVNSDFKAKDMIVELSSGEAFVMNSIYKYASSYENISDAFETFIENEVEVKDAF